MKVRREVLGDPYVDASLAKATELTEPLQDLVTQYVWGTLWAREDLDRRSRSFVNLGILIASNQQHELATHIRGAIRNGITAQEIVGVVLHCTGYCGAPSALSAMRTVQNVFETEGILGAAAS